MAEIKLLGIWDGDKTFKSIRDDFKAVRSKDDKLTGPDAIQYINKVIDAVENNNEYGDLKALRGMRFQPLRNGRAATIDTIMAVLL